MAAWPKLKGLDRLAVALALAVIGVVTIPRLPPGVCFSDSGDLQLASATLGIMHPPGYAGYVTLGYLCTLVPRVDPAYMVSLACLASGIAGLLLCMLMQVRLGVNSWVASALVMALAAHPRVWRNLLAPEVYAPTLAFVAGAAYLLVRYARLGVRRDLLVAATLFGVALANRPTVVWMLPFFLAAWWLSRRGREPSRRRRSASFVLAVSCAALPGVYSLGYLWVRDTSSTPYNYIQHHNAEFNILPDAHDGWQAKLKRLYYHASAREFERYIGNTWRGAWLRLRWLHGEFFLYRPFNFAMVLLLLLVGAVLTYRRCRVSFCLLGGMAVGTVVFVCTYRIYGQAANLLPLLFTATVLGGVALSSLFPLESTSRVRSVTAIGLTVAMCIVTVIDAPNRDRRKSAEAGPFLAELDMQTLPKNTAIFSTWRESTALWYAKHVLTKRRDVEIINTITYKWPSRIALMPHRPVYVITKSRDLDGCKLTPYRNLWRVERSQPTSRF